MPKRKRRKSNATSMSEGHEFDEWSACATTDEVLSKLGTSVNGLDTAEVRQRRVQYGYNQTAKNTEPSPLMELLYRFREPLIIVLLIVATVSLLLGQWVSALLVYFMALASVLLSLAQEHRARNEAKRLNDMVSTTTSAIQEGKQHEVHMRMLVPGDIIYL